MTAKQAKLCQNRTKIADSRAGAKRSKFERQIGAANTATTQLACRIFQRIRSRWNCSHDYEWDFFFPGTKALHVQVPGTYCTAMSPISSCNMHTCTFKTAWPPNGQVMAQKEIICADSQISRRNSHAWLRALRHPSPLWPTGGQDKWKIRTLNENTGAEEDWNRAVRKGNRCIVGTHGWVSLRCSLPFHFGPVGTL